MITAKKIQNEYVGLYACLRNYIWPIQAVSDIADLELECYRAFPNTEKVKSLLESVKCHCKDIEEDEELAESINSFTDILNNCTDIYSKLDKRVEGSNKK